MWFVWTMVASTTCVASTSMSMRGNAGSRNAPRARRLAPFGAGTIPSGKNVTCARGRDISAAAPLPAGRADGVPNRLRPAKVVAGNTDAFRIFDPARINGDLYKSKEKTNTPRPDYPRTRKAGEEADVTITRDGEVIAFYLESEIVCARCATDAEKADANPEESLTVEELEGAVEELWCDRCDASLISTEQAVCCS
jgi:hypothetical protein